MFDVPTRPYRGHDVAQLIGFDSIIHAERERERILSVCPLFCLSHSLCYCKRARQSNTSPPPSSSLFFFFPNLNNIIILFVYVGHVTVGEKFIVHYVFLGLVCGPTSDYLFFGLLQNAISRHRIFARHFSFV